MALEWQVEAFHRGPGRPRQTWRRTASYKRPAGVGTELGRRGSSSSSWGQTAMASACGPMRRGFGV